MIRLRPSTIVTLAVFVGMYALFASQYPAMLSPRVLGDLLTDSAYLGILTIGMTVVIVSGGIDLSVAAVMALCSLTIAVGISDWRLHPLAAFTLALSLGGGLGALNGAAIHYLRAPPFIVTLTTMFLARGGAILLSPESVAVHHPLYAQLTSIELPLPGGGRFSLVAMIMIAAFVLGGILLHRTRFGASVFAIGGDAHAASLMGAPLGRTTVLIYAFSGLMAGLAGIVFSLYTQAGYALSAAGVELEAIAAAVIGGALLSGGVGGMIGAFFGVLIQGVILTYITFDGTLSSWWTKIAIGVLIFIFLVLQKVSGRFKLDSLLPKRTP